MSYYTFKRLTMEPTLSKLSCAHSGSERCCKALLTLLHTTSHSPDGASVSIAQAAGRDAGPTVPVRGGPNAACGRPASIRGRLSGPPGRRPVRLRIWGSEVRILSGASHPPRFERKASLSEASPLSVTTWRLVGAGAFRTRPLGRHGEGFSSSPGRTRAKPRHHSKECPFFQNRLNSQN